MVRVPYLDTYSGQRLRLPLPIQFFIPHTLQVLPSRCFFVDRVDVVET